MGRARIAGGCDAAWAQEKLKAAFKVVGPFGSAFDVPVQASRHARFARLNLCTYIRRSFVQGRPLPKGGTQVDLCGALMAHIVSWGGCWCFGSSGSGGGAAHAWRTEAPVSLPVSDEAWGSETANGFRNWRNQRDGPFDCIAGVLVVAVELRELEALYVVRARRCELGNLAAEMPIAGACAPAAAVQILRRLLLDQQGVLRARVAAFAAVNTPVPRAVRLAARALHAAWCALRAAEAAAAALWNDPNTRRRRYYVLREWRRAQGMLGKAFVKVAAV